MKTKGKAWKLKNQGFTLIEMIVTVAIIAIFSGVVVTFIGTGSGVYRNTSSNSKVQMETQETFDKIEDLIIDANRSLYYANGSDSEIGAEIRNDIKEKGGINSTGNKTFMRMVMAAASIFMMFWTGRHPMRKFIIVAESIQRQAVQTKILTMIRKRKPFQMNQVRIR